jgi:hypothetical protein
LGLLLGQAGALVSAPSRARADNKDDRCACGGAPDCETCFGTGYLRPSAPAGRPARGGAAPSFEGRFLVAICRDGWAKADGFVYPRWVVAHSFDGAAPAARFRNGGPVHLVRSSAMRTAPGWMATFRDYVAGEGGLTCEELTRLAPMFRAARGVPRLLLVAS